MACGPDQQQHGQAEQGGGDEEVGIAMRVHVVAREARDELGQQQHERGKQRVLRGRIADVGEAGEVAHERGRGDARGEVVGRDHGDQRGHAVAVSGQPCEQQIGEGAQDGTEHEDAHHAKAHRQAAAHERADQRHDHAIDLGDAGDLVLGEAGVHIERIGHDAHDHVADAVDGDQREDHGGMPFVAAEEICERFDQRALQPLGGAACGGQLDALGLGRDQHRDDAHEHGGGHHQIGKLPGGVLITTCAAGELGTRGQPQHACARPDHREAVAGLVARGERGLLLGGRGFDAVGVKRDVLRGRGEGRHQRPDDHGLQRHARIGQRHARQPAHHRDLRDQQPTAPASQRPREARQRHAVHDRCPYPFEAVGQTHPAQMPDGAAIDARLAQAKRQRSQHQHERQPGGKPEREHAQAFGLQIDHQGLAPGALGRGFGERGFGHAEFSRAVANKANPRIMRIRRVPRMPQPMPDRTTDTRYHAHHGPPSP